MAANPVNGPKDTITSNEAEHLTALYISLYHELRARYEKETGVPVKEYKRLEPDKLRRFFLDFSQWRASMYNAGALMISKLLVIHPLPNMNHRTAIMWTILFFRANGIAFPCYNVDLEKDKYKSDCVSYIEQSKPLIKARPKSRAAHLEMTKGWVRELIGTKVQSGRLASISPVATSLRILIAQSERPHPSSIDTN
jgi:prophage maintenance system killer protein